MSNAFQVFNLEPAAYVDTDALKNRYLTLSAQSHPDSSSAPDPAQFILIQKAYECLSSDRLRLMCLLGVLGEDETKSLINVSQELGDLFMEVATQLAHADSLIKERTQAESNLEKALLEPRILTGIDELQSLQKNLNNRRTSHHSALKELSQENREKIKYYVIEFSYLDRWISQLQEKMFLLAMSPLDS